MSTPTATVLVCRGCCCGTDDGQLADRQVEQVRDAVASLVAAELELTNCLGPCSDRDVVAVRHRDAITGRRGHTTWLKDVDDRAVVALCDWIVDGAAGRIPLDLRPHVFDPTDVPVTPDDEITPSDRAIS